MKKNISRIIVGLSVVALVGLSVPSPSYSAGGVEEYATGSGMKLGRGILNVALMLRSKALKGL